MLLLFSTTYVLAIVTAQEPPATAPDGATSQPASVPLLSGPAAVDDDAGTLTLVHRSFDGVVESVGPEPDVVAIAMLELTPEQKGRYDEIRSQRMTAFDQIVRNNYGLVVELATLQSETDAKRRLSVLSRTQQALQPYMERGTFFHEMWPHLNDAQRKQTEVMVAEYQYERAQSLKARAGENVTLREIAVRERLNTLGQMLRESIERQVGLERDNFEMLANELELTPEQRNAAEAIYQPLAIKKFQNLEVTPADRSAAFAEFSKLLTAGQRQKVFGILLRQYQGARSREGAASQPATSQPAGDAMNDGG